MKNYTIGFYLEKLYFSPHFEPIIEEVIKRSISYIVIIPQTKHRDELDQRSVSTAYCKQHGFLYCYEEADDVVCDVMVFANTPVKIHIPFQKSASVLHGTWGGKKVDWDPKLNNADVRFIDGQFYEEYLSLLFPEKKSIFFVSGYSKLDSYFKLTEKDKVDLIRNCHLDERKKTILYAPTFYPSSIRKMGKNFPKQFEDYNIILKPHSNIFLRKTYRKDLRILKKWAEQPNVYLSGFDETNILPFFNAADLLISDMSSAVYEFASLKKPVIINLFLYYRIMDRIFKKKIAKRLDTPNFHLWKVGDTPKNYNEMVRCCKENLEHPDKNKEQREALAQYVVGNVDGHVSQRIVDKLLDMKQGL